MCGDYFIGKNIEMVSDSHFGHLVPIAYLRLLKVYATSSFNQAPRMGISNIAELSKKKYTTEEKIKQIEKHRNFLENKEDKFDPYTDDFENTEEDIKPYAVRKSNKKFSLRSIKTPLQLFEKLQSMKPRGEYQVWKTMFRLEKNSKVTLYLQVVNDSKPDFRGQVNTEHYQSQR